MSPSSNTGFNSFMNQNSLFGSEHVSHGSNEDGRGHGHLDVLNNQAHGYEGTLLPFNAEIDGFMAESNGDGDLSMNAMFGESPTDPRPIFPRRSASNTATRVSCLDETDSIGYSAESGWEGYDPVFERSSNMARSPTATSASENSLPENSFGSYYSRQRRYERYQHQYPQGRHSNLDLVDVTLLSPSLGSPASPFTAPTSQFPSFNGHSPGGIPTEDFNNEWWSRHRSEDAGAGAQNSSLDYPHELISDVGLPSFSPTSQIPPFSLDTYCLPNTSYGSLDHHRHFNPSEHLTVPKLVAHPPSPGREREREREPPQTSQASVSNLTRLFVHGSRDRGYSDPLRPSDNLLGTGPSASAGMTRTPSSQTSNSSDGDLEMGDDATVDKSEGSKPVDIHHRLPRGKRHGPLTDKGKHDAKTRRNNRSVCIRCKVNKAKCEKEPGDSACQGCIAARKRDRGPVVCSQAHFLDPVQAASTIHPPQPTMEHLRLDRKTRRRIPLGSVRMGAVVDRLNKIRSRFDIRVSFGGQLLCVLDLDKCYHYLGPVRPGQGGSDLDFRSFLNKGKGKGTQKQDNWADCLKDCDAATEQLNLLPVWSNMPGRATYSYLWKDRPLPSGQLREEDINVDDEEGQRNLIVASIIFHIFVRRLELEAFAKLHKKLHGKLHGAGADKKKDEDAPQLLRQLGRTLLTLRWRLSWYRMFAKSVQWTAQEKVQFDARLLDLCRTLYFFFCYIEKKFSGRIDQGQIRGEKRRYEDTITAVDDDFPTTETLEGFEEWIAKGRDLIFHSGAFSREQEMGLLKN